MRENILKLSILSLILISISSIILILFGRVYTASFKLNSASTYNIELENETGRVEILDEKKVGNNYIVKVKSQKPGRATLVLNNDDYQQNIVLYVHNTMVITENTLFGKSSASEVIPISLSVFLLYLLYLLIKRYNHCKEVSIYQYKNIAYLGIIIFISIFTLTNIISIFRYQGLYDTIERMISSTSIVSLFIFPIALIMSILVTISNIRLIRREGLSIRNLLGLLLGMFICIATLLPDFVYNILMKIQLVDIYNQNSIGPYLYSFLESLIYTTIAYLECVLIGTIIIALKSVKQKEYHNIDYMIILGCKIRNDGSLTPLLRGRVDKAIEFRNKQKELTGKDLVFVPSGGKGKDEIISEAEAMKNYLLDQGINKKNILVEDKSTNTYENIKFSNKLINDKNANICFSTTNYHVLRAGLIATSQGLSIQGIGSKTKAYFWINAFIREFIGTINSEKKKHIIVFILIALVIMIMIGITYIVNNTN